VNISIYRNILSMAPYEPSTDPASQLALLFGQMMGLIHGRFAGESLALMHETGLTLPQLVALHVLRYRGPSTISGISATLNLSASATSTLIDKAVEKGVVTRTEDPEDRRQKRLELTYSGNELLDRLNSARTEEFNRAFSSLGPELQIRLIGIFEQVISELSQPLSQDETVCLVPPKPKIS
jgi:DNA-binding MarR family transcriptional regulator